LRIFANRKLEDLIIVDNHLYSYIFNIDNGVPILDFYDDKEDIELLKVAEFLKTLKDVPDVRTNIANAFKFSKFLDNDNFEQVLY